MHRLLWQSDCCVAREFCWVFFFFKKFPSTFPSNISDVKIRKVMQKIHSWWRWLRIIWVVIYFDVSTSLETNILKSAVLFAGVKRICFGHALDEDNMRFSCFPRAANILGKRGSINLTPLPGTDESNSIASLSVVSFDSTTSRAETNFSLYILLQNGSARNAVIATYKQSGEPDLTHGVVSFCVFYKPITEC